MSKIKRNVKDTVFTCLFKINKYKLALYKLFHPEDKNVTIANIKTITLSSVIAGVIYNDLGMMVNNQIIFLMEAQTIWSVNVLLRIFLYLAETYKNYIRKNNLNIYGTKKIFLPRPELYIVYTGSKNIREGVHSFGEEFFGVKPPIDLKVTVIRKAKSGSILQQYIDFAKRSDALKKKKMTDKDLENFINKCIKDGILSEFLSERKEEIMSTMKLLYDQDVIDEMRFNESREEGIKIGEKRGERRGERRGEEKGRTRLIIELINNGTITLKEAKDKYGYKLNKKLATVD